MSKKKIDRIDPESYEQGRDPHYPSWKSDAQWEKMNADFERLQREEKDNYPKIIASLQELKKKYEQLLTQLEHRFEEQRVFYQNEINRLTSIINEEIKKAELRIVELEKHTNHLAKVVNENTERLNTFIKERNEEKERVSRLAKKACEKAIGLYQQVSSDKIATKHCYYKLKGVEFQIGQFNDAKTNVEALYAIAINVIASLEEIKAVAELEWKKFYSVYTSLHDEVNLFCNEVKNAQPLHLEENPDEIVDIDFWTYGRYNGFRSNIDLLNKRVVSGEYASNYTLTDVKIDNDRLKQYREEIESLRQVAFDRCTKAYRRLQFGIRVAECLINHGFNISTSQFEGNDHRNAYIIEAVRLEDEIKVTIVFHHKNNPNNAQLLIRHGLYIDPNAYEDFVNDLQKDLNSRCGIRCNLPEDKSGSPLDYYDDILMEDGNLNEKINIIFNYKSNRL